LEPCAHSAGELPMTPQKRAEKAFLCWIAAACSVVMVVCLTCVFMA
jgi:hypothetical protein